MGPFFSRFARLLFFFAAIAVVYLPGLSGVFILDDIPVFSHINSIQNFNDFVEYIVSGQAGPIGRPLSMASFAANFLVAGEVSPIAFKSVNLFLHLLTGGAIYLLCCELFRLFEGRPSNNWALLITVLWLFSSIHTSTVYYAVQRMTILASLFSVLAIWTYIKCRQTMLKGKAGSAYFIASVARV